MMDVENTLVNLQNQTSYVENATQNIKRRVECLHNSTSNLVAGKCTMWNLVCGQITLPCQHDPFSAQSLHLVSLIHKFCFSSQDIAFNLQATFASFHRGFAHVVLALFFALQGPSFTFIYSSSCQRMYQIAI